MVEGVSDVLVQAWSRATAAGAPPDRAVVLVSGALVLVALLGGASWHLLRHLLTVLHEGGHGLAALLTGRRLTGIRLHSDTSGLTVSVGRPRGPGMVLTLLAGYPAPALVGLGTAWLVVRGHGAGALWALLLVVALMLLQIRNLYGLWVLLVVGVVLVGVTWWAPPDWQVAAACALAWLLLLGAPRAVVEMARQRGGRHGRGSDADQLGAITPLPGGGWVVVLLVACLTALVVGARMLLAA